MTKEQVIAQPDRFGLIARSNSATVALLSRLDHPDKIAVVWSLWGGYWLRTNPLKAFCQRQNIDPLFIHSGGHACEEDLKRLVNAISPRVIVPIHTGNAPRFAEVFSGVRLIDDGNPAEISALLADSRIA